MLVRTPKVYISNYFIQLDKYKPDYIHATLQLSEQKAGQKVRIEIPELKIASEVQTDGQGMAKISFRAKKLERWSPQKPKLYQVTVSTATDHVNQFS